MEDVWTRVIEQIEKDWDAETNEEEGWSVEDEESASDESEIQAFRDKISKNIERQEVQSEVDEILSKLRGKLPQSQYDPDQKLTSGEEELVSLQREYKGLENKIGKIDEQLNKRDDPISSVVDDKEALKQSKFGLAYEQAEVMQKIRALAPRAAWSDTQTADIETTIDEMTIELENDTIELKRLEDEGRPEALDILVRKTADKDLKTKIAAAKAELTFRAGEKVRLEMLPELAKSQILTEASSDPRLLKVYEENPAKFANAVAKRHRELVETHKGESPEPKFREVTGLPQGPIAHNVRYS